MNNKSNIPTNRFCLIFLSVEHVYISKEKGCRTYCNDDIFLVHQKRLNTTGTCHLQGGVTNAQFLRSDDNRDSLIFLKFEGCYSIDKNGSKSSGAILVTNDVNKNYHEQLNIEYFWTTIEADIIGCNMLCKGVFFDRCFVDMNENSAKKYLERFKNMHEFFYLKPLRSDNFFSNNQKIIFIIFGAAFVIFCVSLVLSIVYRKGLKTSQ